MKPGYEQKAFPVEERTGKFALVASRDGRDESLKIHQDAALYVGNIEAGAEISKAIGPARHVWLQVARGSVTIGEHELSAGDGASISDEAAISVKASTDAEVLLFDLA